MTKDKIEFYLHLATQVALRATCPRASVGAILVMDDRVVSMGYNGSPRGVPHCKDVDQGGCWLHPKGNKQSCFRAVHAEANAIVNAAYGGVSTKGAWAYCTHKPCVECLKLLINAGVSTVYYIHHYPTPLTDQLIQDAAGKVQLIHWNGGRGTSGNNE